MCSSDLIYSLKKRRERASPVFHKKRDYKSLSPRRARDMRGYNRHYNLFSPLLIKLVGFIFFGDLAGGGIYTLE